MSVGGWVLLCPGAPPPNPRGGQGEGRPGAEGGSRVSSALLNGCGVGGKAPLGPPPRGSGGSLPVSSAEAWPAHHSPEPAGFCLHAGHHCPDLPGSLMRQAPIGGMSCGRTARSVCNRDTVG